MSYSSAVAVKIPRDADPAGGILRRAMPTARIVIEAAWAYRYRPAVGPSLRKRQASASAEVKAIAWKAQHRLNARYRHLTARGKCKQETVTAVGRELLGFIWAIGVKVEAEGRTPKSAAA
jgi:hypothetical protein